MTSTSSVGSWKQSDLPEAVPVVTIVGASKALSSASRWCMVERVDAGALQRVVDARVELVGDRDQERLLGERQLVVDQALVGAAGLAAARPRVRWWFCWCHV